MATPVELIKEKLDVATVLRGYIELTPAGRNFKARCPFHSEKTASFVVTPDRGSWKCFGCGLGGDIFSFVQQFEHVEFPDALRLLAEKAGVELRRVNPAEERFTGALYRANAAAAEFFREQAKADIPQAYLRERGITQEAADFFEIGWAPPDQDLLARYLTREGFDKEDLVRSGLVLDTDYGMRDRFRARLMFPIWSALGKTVAFTGRIHPDFDTGNLGKYVNSPETPVFTKGKVLYAYGKTKEAIRQSGRALLVEGQVDAVACWQAGAKNVVALSGTALTAEHVGLLGRSAQVVDLAFDADDAGWAAAEKAAHLALGAGLEITVVRWPGGKDAADVAKEDPAAVLAAVEAAVPVVEAWTEHLLASASFRDRAGVGALRRVLALLNRITSPVLRSQWFQYVARKTGIDEGTLREESRSGIQVDEQRETTKGVDSAPERAPRTEATRWDALAEQVLSAAYHTRDLARVQGTHLPEGFRDVLERLRAEESGSDDSEVDALLQRIIVAPSVVLGSSNMDRLLRELEDCYLAAERARISGLIADAERAGDDAALEAALASLAALPRR